MGLLDWINPINKITEIVDKAVPDKDLRAQLKSQLDTLKEQSYQIELQSKTIPWVDAIHKMGRQIMALLTMLVTAGMMLYLNRPLEPQEVAGLGGVGGIYAWIKGKGR